MPNDVKAIVSVVTLIVAIGLAYWEKRQRQAGTVWFVIGFAICAVIAMRVFPEAQGGSRTLDHEEAEVRVRPQDA